MGSFGERMQREREMRTVTLEQIAESTKIGTRMLHALEAEDFAKLPGGIFNKGFVRAYAKYLGLDEEQAVSDFMAAYAEFQADAERSTIGEGALADDLIGHGASEPGMVAAIQASDDQVQPSQGAGFMLAAVIFVVILGAGGLFFKYYQNKKSSDQLPVASSSPKSRREKKKVPAVATNEITTATATPNPVADNPSSGITSVLAASAEPSSNSRIASPIENSYPEYSHVSDPAISGAPTVKTSEKKKLNLQIRAKEESWVKITADGQILMEGILPPSVSRQFRATKQLIVKLGNAGVVELSYNGKVMPAFSPETKTKTLTFTADGLGAE